jgi:hypothetical protein
MRFIWKEKTQTFFKLVTTLIVWGGVLYTSLFPKEVHSLSTRMGFGENLNTLIFFGFVVVFVIIFRLLAVIERTESQLTDLVRKIALKDLDKANAQGQRSKGKRQK